MNFLRVQKIVKKSIWRNKRMIKSKTVYFCAGWFTEKQNKAYSEAMKAIENNPTVDVPNSYVPLQNQYKGLRVYEQPELLENREWSITTSIIARLSITTLSIHY